MTKQELEAVHDDYNANIAEWLFFVRSYFGGKAYREGKYLKQHPFESPANYARRNEIAYFYNYCSPIVDIFVSHLFKRPPHRDYGSMASNPLFQSFVGDADLEGNTYSQFIREAARLAAAYGRVTVIVDKPAMTVSTEAEAIDNDIRPYLSLVTPENVLDWQYVRLNTGRVVLDSIKIREGKNRYRIWTRTGWALYEVTDNDTETGAEILPKQTGTHDLGIVPAVNIYNKNTSQRMIGASDLADIAHINKNIYYLCSDAKEIIENTAFPMLAQARDRGLDDEQSVGPSNIVDFDPDAPNGKPFWLEPPHSSLAEIREWIQQDITEIFRLAKMAGMKTTEVSVQPWSGVALEVQNQQLMAALVEKADNMEQAETQILRLWALWEGKQFDGAIKYPQDFSIQDINTDFQNTVVALGTRIDSALYKRELQKKVVRQTLPKVTKETRNKIYKQIESAKIDLAIQPNADTNLKQRKNANN